MSELEEFLQHHGVKGQKWGVIRKTKIAKGISKGKARVKEEVGSMKRERDWKKVGSNIDKMSTKEIKDTSRRIQMENDFKRLKGKDKTLKKVYRQREKLSDKELTEKVGRLVATDNLKRNIANASKGQIDSGKKIVAAVSTIGVTYFTSGKIAPSDMHKVVNAYKNPKSAKDQNGQAIVKKVMEKYQ